MEDGTVKEFRQKVLEGQFSDIKSQLMKLNVSQEQLKFIEYQIFEQ